MNDNGNGQNQGAIVRGLSWLFGANFRSKLSGYISLLALLIHQKPEWIQFISEPARGIIWQLSEYIAIGGFASMVHNIKDRQVGLQQTSDGKMTLPKAANVLDLSLKADEENKKP